MYVDVPFPYPPAVRVLVRSAQRSIAMFAQDEIFLRGILCDTLCKVSDCFLLKYITKK
jgi:hypothetical protein